MLIAIIFLLIGFNLGRILDLNTTEVSKPVLPNCSKIKPFENYSNKDVRDAIFFSREYINNPESLKEDYSSVYNYWFDYRLDVCNDYTFEKRMKYYNHWIMCYAFGLYTIFGISEIIIPKLPINDEITAFEKYPEAGLPRFSKSSPFEDYTHDEVKYAINFSMIYLNNPESLGEDYPHVYNLWLDYRSRVCNNNPINTIKWHYNYWIISYSFGI